MKKKRLLPNQIAQIQIHRQKGLSIGEISILMNVAKSTVLRHIQTSIDNEYLPLWKSKRGGSLKNKLKKEANAKIWAEKMVSIFTERELLFFISALYWGEGSKRDFEIINSNANLLKVFVHGMRIVFGLSNEDIGIVIRLFNKNIKDQCSNYWLAALNLPVSSIKGYEIINGKKDGKLPFGMCRVRIRKGGDYLKKLKALNLEFAESIYKVPVA